MEKYLFILLLTIAGYGQTYQNPTFGTITTKTAPAVISVNHLATVEASGVMAKIVPTSNIIQNASIALGATVTDALNTLDASMVHKTGSLSETITGAKSVVNSVFPRTNYFQFTNNYNSGSNNRTLQNVPLNTFNNFGGIGFHFDNLSTGWGAYGFNESTGVLLGLDSKTASTGDLLQFSKKAVTTARFAHDGSLYTTYGQFGTSTAVLLPQMTVTNGGNASVIEFPKTGFNVKGTVGALGNYEMNMSCNMDYTSQFGVHRFYDNTLDATWFAVGTQFWQMQFAPASAAAGDVWTNAGQPRALIQDTKTGMMRINTTAALSTPGSTFGDAMFAVRRAANFATIAGETDLVIEGAKTKGVSAPILINNYNVGNVSVVTGGGKFGIGTSSPNFNTQIASLTSSSILQLTSTATGSTSTDGFAIAVNAAGGVDINQQENNYIRFFTNGGERFRIHASGGVSIGNTTDLGTGTLNVSGNISTIAATTANHVIIKSQHDLKADLVSPIFTGNPTAPTPTAGDNDTSIATTAFVNNLTSSGSYTPTVSASTNCVSPSALLSTYTINGNIITLGLLVLAVNFTAANTFTTMTVNLPINRTLNDVKSIGCGSGYNATGDYWAAIVQTAGNNNTMLVSFKTPSTNGGNINLFVQYDITK